MDITYKRLNKLPKSRKINFYIGKKMIAQAEPFGHWYSCHKTDDEELNKEIRKIIIDNLYWLIGRDNDYEYWVDEVNRYDSKPLIDYTPYDKIPSSLFFNEEEKESALKSFFKETNNYVGS